MKMVDLFLICFISAIIQNIYMEIRIGLSEAGQYRPFLEVVSRRIENGDTGKMICPFRSGWFFREYLVDQKEKMKYPIKPKQGHRCPKY